ncbi:MAG: spermine synthase [Chloroflexi bacterium HGW-Chloroflexi-8]|nr:MAG: spermine synthase [Chloroflexi bacterium HGW-Chloroflexi-8]
MRKILYLAVFISGMVSLAAEMAASRLLGNYFGTSNLVWASIIGLILIYLTFGYFLGGKWADRSPHMSTFLSILAWAALSLAIVPIASRPILKLSSQAFDQLWMGDLIGSFVVVMILFIIPITLLGTASPFAIRIAIQNANQAGEISGRIYAISTLGSFFGTFLPSIILIPLIGTYLTFLVISSVLLVFSLIALGLTVGWKLTLKYCWMLVIVIGLAIFGTRGTDKIANGMVLETESAYNYIQVLEQNGYYLLRLNEGQGIHSVFHPDQNNYYGPWEQVLVAPFFNQPPIQVDDINSMAIVGLAAGTSARQAAIVYPNIAIDGFEIDPKIVDVAKEYFGMNLPQLSVIEQDGRWGLASSNKKYDIISIDAYRPPYIPWHLTTREFFQQVYDHMEKNGVMVINVGRGIDDRRLIDSLGSTILSVFPTVHVMDLPNSFNSILFATVQPTDKSNLALNFKSLQNQPGMNPLLMDTMSITLQNLAENPQPAQVFTDDLAPIEWLTNSLIVDFFLKGEVENLQ